jgi:hypothetical protein
MHQLGAAVPDRRPLRPNQHAIIGELSIEVPDWILEDNCGVDRQEVLIEGPLKLERTEDC